MPIPAPEDRAAIIDLLQRYGDAVNRRDTVQWASCWHEEAEWSLEGPPVHGRDAIVAQWEAAMAGFPLAIMHVTPGVIAIHGDRARGRSYTFERLRTADGCWMQVHGGYEDEYALCDGAWTFTRRAFTILDSKQD
jgi:hypothetical protein